MRSREEIEFDPVKVDQRLGGVIKKLMTEGSDVEVDGPSSLILQRTVTRMSHIPESGRDDIERPSQEVA